MEMLNNANMFLAVGGLWGILIDVFAKWIVNYGWAIIVFTIALKLIISPLDFFQRKSSAKQQKVMAAMQPEMNKLQEKYKDNREKYNQEVSKLYRKYNMGAGGMCFTLLLTLVLTMVIFFTLYSSLRSYGTDKLYSNYEKLDAVYVQAETNGEDVKQAVLDEYKIQSNQNSWLWVKNVWKSDTNTDQLVAFDDYAKHQGLSDELKVEAEVRYKAISEIVEEENPGQNGYYVLLIMAAVISFLTQFLSAKLMTPKGQKLNTLNKIMFVVIPLTMVTLASTSNVVFTLYIITNSIMSAIISTVLFFITKDKNKNGGNEEILLQKKNIQVVEYSRNYKK